MASAGLEMGHYKNCFQGALDYLLHYSSKIGRDKSGLRILKSVAYIFQVRAVFYLYLSFTFLTFPSPLWFIIIRLAPQAGKMNQILRCDWLP